MILSLIPNSPPLIIALSIIITIITTTFSSLLMVQSKSNNSMKKIHPTNTTNNITIKFNADTININSKKLRRLPHVFSRVLELPFRSDADVAILEAPDCFRFVAETDPVTDVMAHTVQIHPGVIKIVVRVGGSVELSLDQLEIDMWRFRLPESTQPELASAVFVNGELIVTVPKRYDDYDGGGGDGDFGRFVLVQ